MTCRCSNDRFWTDQRPEGIADYGSVFHIVSSFVFSKSLSRGNLYCIFLYFVVIFLLYFIYSSKHLRFISVSLFSPLHLFEIFLFSSLSLEMDSGEDSLWSFSRKLCSSFISNLLFLSEWFRRKNHFLKVQLAVLKFPYSKNNSASCHHYICAKMQWATR